jgi:UDPglucose--hexose-1-phosphate uridylyltransferase
MMVDFAKPHRRYNPLSGGWVQVSPQRMGRPWQGEVSEPDPPPPAYDPTCYLCPGNARVGGEVNPDYSGVHVFANDFPALATDSNGAVDPDPLLRAEASAGVCRVICFSPDHGKSLPELSPEQLRQVIDTWCDQTAELGERFANVQVFENKGAMMGCSNPHPHGQVWATALIPQEIAKEDTHQRAYHADHGRALLADVAERETASGERVVEINDDWLAIVPFWAAWPFETLLLPRFSVQRMPALSSAQRDSLAAVLKALATRYDNLFQTSFPYSMGWHQAPFGMPDIDHWQLHAHFYPPLLRSASVRKFMVGYEMLAEPQRDRMNRRDALIDRAVAGYRAAYGTAPTALFAAPGRVNLIGEHTDYNDGLVLPCAIDRETIMAIGPGVGDRIEAVALDLGDARDGFALAEPITPAGEEWGRHLRGVAHFLQERGCALASARIAIAGDVPIGAGLSSSASLGVVSGLALSQFAGCPQPPEALARIAQAAENHFVGTQCGIMDQMASACAHEGHALLLDCRDLTYRHIAMPQDLALVIIDSGVRHSLGDSPYNERRAQCEAAAAHYGKASLRDVAFAQLEAERGGLDDGTYRRARHVVTEIARVVRFAEALAAGNAAAIAALMAESFASYRDDFEASVPAVDRLFAAISAVLGNSGGVRLTGGGFGGSLVALAPRDALADIAAAVAPCGAEVFLPSGGAAQID